jgi:hypothetical protein
MTRISFKQATPSGQSGSRHLLSERTPIMLRPARILAACGLIAASACSDSSTAPGSSSAISADEASDTKHGGTHADFSRYYAIGNSISMGWTDDGVVGAGQANAWPSLLAAAAQASFTTPRIAAPGCAPALAAPLASFARVDGSSVAATSTVCAPNEAGVSLPTNNLAIEGATAVSAISETPEAPAPDRDRPAVVSRVLPAGRTQVSAMRAANPTFVSVDLGGNEVLPAQAGILVSGLTYTPYATWRAAYAQVIDNVKATGAKALLMALPHDIRQFPTIRTGPEIAAQRAAFANFNVLVASDCDASPNFIFVRGKVLTAIATANVHAQNHYGPYTLSCADGAGVDYVLPPNDVAFINGLLGQMNTEIARQAAANGYALSTLDVLYAPSKIGVPFDLLSFLTSPSPYGQAISLDGVHPTAKGQKILAAAAILAVDLRYSMKMDPFVN